MNTQHNTVCNLFEQMYEIRAVASADPTLHYRSSFANGRVQVTRKSSGVHEQTSTSEHAALPDRQCKSALTSWDWMG